MLKISNILSGCMVANIINSGLLLLKERQLPLKGTRLPPTERLIFFTKSFLALRERLLYFKDRSWAPTL